MSVIKISFEDLKNSINDLNAAFPDVGLTVAADFHATMVALKEKVLQYSPAGVDPADLPAEQLGLLFELFPTVDNSLSTVDEVLATIEELVVSGNIGEVTGNADQFLSSTELARLGGVSFQVQTKNNGISKFQAVPFGTLPLAPSKTMSACIETVRFTSRTGTNKDGNVIGHLLAEGLLSNGSEFSQDFYEGFLNTILGRRVFGATEKKWADPNGDVGDLPRAGTDRCDWTMRTASGAEMAPKYVQVRGIAPVAKKHVFLVQDTDYVAAVNAINPDLVFDHALDGSTTTMPTVAIVWKATIAFTNGRINKILNGKAADLFQQEMDKSFEARADIAGKLGADQAIMDNEEVLIAGAESRARILAAGNDTLTAARAATIAAYKAAGLDDAMIVALIGKDMEIAAAAAEKNA